MTFMVRGQLAAGIRPAVILAVALLAVGCGSTLPVKTQRDPSIPIPSGASWAWNATPPADTRPGELDPRVNNPTIHGRIERAVETVLTAKGFRQVESVAAVFLVNYRVGVREVLQRQTTVAGGPGTAHMVMIPQEFTEGGLLIDFLERSTGKLAFRSWVLGEIHEGAGSEKAIHDLVTRLLETLP